MDRCDDSLALEAAGEELIVQCSGRCSPGDCPGSPSVPMHAPDEGEAGGPASDITDLLRQVEQGVEGARQHLVGLVYTELHRRAAHLMRQQSKEHTLQATALVNEVYMRLFSKSPRSWNDRKHFLTAAGRAMRHVLIDHARRKERDRRGGGRESESLDCIVHAYHERSFDVLALDDSLEKLKAFDEGMARAVELRFFGGATGEEAARILDMSQRAFARRWQAARAWLYKEIR